MAATHPLDIVELRLYIGYYLRTSDLFHCVLVSKSWFETFFPLLWETSHCTWSANANGVPSPSSPTLSTLKKYGSMLRALSLMGHRSWRLLAQVPNLPIHNLQRVDFVTEHTAKTSSVHSTELKRAAEKGLVELLQKNSKSLQRLEWNATDRRLDGDDEASIAAIAAAAIAGTTLTVCPVSKTISELESLHTLTLINKIDFPSLATMLRGPSSSKLKVLRLRDTDFKLSSPQSLGGFTSNLEEVYIYKEDFPTEDFPLFRLVSLCPKLRVLSIVAGDNFFCPQGSLSAPEFPLPDLRVMRLRTEYWYMSHPNHNNSQDDGTHGSAVDYRDAGLAYILRGAYGLQELDVSYSAFGRLGLEVLLTKSRCRNLTIVRIAGTKVSGLELMLLMASTPELIELEACDISLDAKYFVVCEPWVCNKLERLSIQISGIPQIAGLSQRGQVGFGQPPEMWSYTHGFVYKALASLTELTTLALNENKGGSWGQYRKKVRVNNSRAMRAQPEEYDETDEDCGDSDDDMEGDEEYDDEDEEDEHVVPAQPLHFGGGGAQQHQQLPQHLPPQQQQLQQQQFDQSGDVMEILTDDDHFESDEDMEEDSESEHENENVHDHELQQQQYQGHQSQGQVEDSDDEDMDEIEGTAAGLVGSHHHHHRYHHHHDDDDEGASTPPVAFASVVRLGGLSLTLRSGLDQLKTLQKLKVFSVNCTQHAIGQEEIRWMQQHWPLLQELPKPIDFSEQEALVARIRGHQ